MHIVYHHRTLADGAEGIHIREMIQAFRQLGHRVTVLGAVGEGGPRAARASSVRAHFPQGLFEMGALAYSALDYMTIARLLRVQRADLVYKRHALLDVGVALAAKHAGIPLVLEVNTAYASAMLQSFEPLSFPSLAARAERTAFRNATVVATVSSPLAEYVTQAAPSAGMVMVVPNGADPQKFRRREGLGDQLRRGKLRGVDSDWSRGIGELLGDREALDKAVADPARLPKVPPGMPIGMDEAF